jgi:hypothetical protein
MNFKPNIGTGGRVFRLMIALGLIVAGIFAPLAAIPRVVIFISAAFVLFEALRGWCFLRACGIRTKL